MVKKCLLATVMAIALIVSADAKELKVLMIGNSFSDSVLQYLPKIVESDKENKLVLAQMYIGGCTFNRHVRELQAAEKDPGYRPYRTNYPTEHKANLPEMIGREKWDIVTIQQGSHESWQPDKFPDAAELIAYVKEHAPQAEIVIHQTWSYRNSDRRIGGKTPVWGFDQQGMYDRLTQNYTDLAKQYGFRIIPVGKAVQVFRETTPIRYTVPTDKELYSYVCPDLPRQAGDVVGRSSWVKNQKNGEMFLATDSIHLNNEGCYLQACVWYGFLFDKKPSAINFIPNNIGNKQAAFLQSCAQKALDEFPQVKE